MCWKAPGGNQWNHHSSSGKQIYTYFHWLIVCKDQNRNKVKQQGSGISDMQGHSFNAGNEQLAQEIFWTSKNIDAKTDD